MISSTGLFALGVLFSVQGQIPILGAEVGIGLDRTMDPSSYLIGPGDVISVVVEGGCTPYMLSAGLLPLAEYTVSTDGVLAVSGIGQIRAAGLTLSGLENELSILARATYPSSSIGVSLVEARLVKVTIPGTVVRPGGYTLSAVQRVSALVDSAQSFSAYSSRIGRMLVEGQNEIEVNLLINPETGRPFSDPYLTNGAVVEFSPCLDPVYVLIGNRSGMGIPRTATVETVDLYRPTDLESFLSGFRLRDQQLLEIHAAFPGPPGIEGVFGIHDGGDATRPLCLRRHVQRQRGLAGGLRAEQFDHPAARQALASQGQIQ